MTIFSYLVTIAGAAWLASAVVRLVEWIGGDGARRP